MPSSSKPLSREFRIYLALWRKAYRDYKANPSAQPLTIKASTFSTALSIRQGLYRAIRPFRYGDEHDEELLAAAEVLVVAATKSSAGPCVISFKPRTTLSELEAELVNLRLDEEDLQTPIEKKIAKSLDNLLGEVKSNIPASNLSTPFYTRS